MYPYWHSFYPGFNVVPFDAVPANVVPVQQQPYGLGRRWIVQEGSWRGVWTRRGNSNVFDGRWSQAGQPDITAVLTIYTSGPYIFILRRNSSDGNNCNYTGIFGSNGRTASGQNICNRGGGSWSAVIERRDQPEDRLGRRWNEQEGGWTGVWTRRGNSNIFDARWTQPGQQDVTAVLSISIDGNTVRVARRNSSDGNNCDYRGTLSGDGRTVSGQFTCDRGGGSWRATIVR
ncbi:hypothetical protein [Domibacillus indicus]|uniref:hypothetical protein n=1 Tax=Domibacillus indicus TaxID=1437523 RepID=UPI000617F9FE|nr:hypothetical protein [Domibacillus indicus]